MIRAKKSLGQNFLIDKDIINKIVSTVSISDNEILEVKERMMWRCDAGLIEHSSIPNKGKIPRINLSFGFLMPIKTTLKKSLL